jgi:hypothetical protein
MREDGLAEQEPAPFTIVGLERQSDGVTLYRIKSRTHEHLASEDELKLSLARPEDE